LHYFNFFAILNGKSSCVPQEPGSIIGYKYIHKMERDKEFLEFIVKSIVNNPEDVKIERSVDEMGVLLTLSVNKDDMAQIIGKSGRTSSAVRTLLRVIGMKDSSRVNLKIDEPEGGIKEGEKA